MAYLGNPGSTGQVLTVAGGVPAWTSATGYVTYCEQTWALNGGTIASGATVTPTLVTGTSMTWTAYVTGTATLSTDATGLKVVTTAAGVGYVHLPIAAVGRFAFGGKPWRIWALWDSSLASWTNANSYEYTGVSIGTDGTRDVLLARNGGSPVIYTSSTAITTPLTTAPPSNTNASMTGDVHMVEQYGGMMQAYVGANSGGAFPSYSSLRPYFVSSFGPNLLNVSSNAAGTQQSTSHAVVGMEATSAATIRLLRTRFEIGV